MIHPLSSPSLLLRRSTDWCYQRVKPAQGPDHGGTKKVGMSGRMQPVC
jgi:hypothetical protein